MTAKKAPEPEPEEEEPKKKSGSGFFSFGGTAKVKAAKEEPKKEEPKPVKRAVRCAAPWGTGSCGLWCNVASPAPGAKQKKDKISAERRSKGRCVTGCRLWRDVGVAVSPADT